MLLDQLSELGQVLHLLHRLAEGGKVGQELGIVATGPRQTPPGHDRTVEVELALDELHQHAAALGRRGRQRPSRRRTPAPGPGGKSRDSPDSRGRWPPRRRRFRRETAARRTPGGCRRCLARECGPAASPARSPSNPDRRRRLGRRCGRGPRRPPPPPLPPGTPPRQPSRGLASGPERIFTVTGIDTARTTAWTIRPMAAGSAIKAPPSPRPRRRRMGHSKFRSTRLKPSSSTTRAASAITAGSAPLICPERGASSGSV